MEAKTIKIAVEAKTTLPYKKLEPFQDDLKTISKEQYERMRENILHYGFSFAIHIWQNKGKNYIIDGHQRLFTLSQLADVEGYKIPDIPVALIKAKSFQEAKEKVLAGASQYGRVSENGLHDFLEKNHIQFELMSANFDFPEIDFGKFSDQFYAQQPGSALPNPEDFSANQMKSGSDQVKQVQLLFNAENHAEFMNKAEALSKKYKTENVTDTVMEALREEYKSKCAQPK